MSQATVTYQFTPGNVTLTVVVNTPAANYEASDQKMYPAFAIQSGSIQYEVQGQKQTFPLAGNGMPFNALWALGGAGSGGSSFGIDTYGLDIPPGDLNLSWNGSSAGPNSFNLNALGNITLTNCSNWPPKA